MKWTYYTVDITTPSGNAQDEKDKHFNWSHPMIQDYSTPSFKKDEIERAVCNHVRSAHTKQQQKRIVSICMSGCWFGQVQIEWKNNAEVVTIPKMKQTGSYTEQNATAKKKRRTFHFHFKNEPVTRFGVCHASLTRCEDGEEVNDDDPELNNGDAWIELSDRLRDHADKYMKSFPYKFKVDGDFGVEASTGVINIEIEQEDEDETLEFPPLQVKYNGIAYEFTFSDVEWDPVFSLG